MRKYFVLSIVVLVFFVSGCFIQPKYMVEKEGRKFITDYPANKLAVARAIKEHRVMYGMTMEEVIESWGNPEIEHELIINGKVYYSWAYRKDNRTRILYFNCGILVDIE